MKLQREQVAYVVFLGMTIAVSVSVLLGYSNLFSSAQELVLPSGEMVGGDFIAFYTGATFASRGLPLYDFSEQLQFQLELTGLSEGSHSFLPFVYPPLVATALSPLAMLSFLSAFYSHFVHS